MRLRDRILIYIPICLGLGALVALVLPRDAEPAPIAPVVVTVTPSTPAWGEPLDQGWLDAMRDEDPKRDWTVCRIEVADTTVVRCPDGYSWES